MNCFFEMSLYFYLFCREVSLRDISQKRGIDLRLLHAVAYGKSWFGQWGYVYGRGSFGVNQIMYQSAIEALQSIPINLLAHHLATDKTETLTTMLRYQILSGHSLITLVDLFRFMLETKSRLPKESVTESPPQGLLVDASCRWSPKRVEMAIRGVIEALKRAEYRWISRQEVRDAARAYIGDTGLLDFVLKSLGNQVVGKYFVRRCMNPVTKVLEYCLEDISYAFPSQDGYRVSHDSNLKLQYNLTWNQLMKDLFFLYKHILKENEVMNSCEILAHMPVASRIILDTKYFIKDYYGEPPTLHNHDLCCSVVLISKSEVGLRKVITPHELFMVRDNSTLDELRMEVEKSFRDLYMGLRNLVVGSVSNFEGMTGSDYVSKLINGGNQIIFEGKIAGDENLDLGLIYESGEINSVVVDCCCGTTDDDGERMVSCDICEVRQHTRCVKIPNHEEVPSIFLCSSCEQYLLHFPSFL